MGGRTILTLMWKHLMVRTKRYITTSVELLSPTLFYGILYVCKFTVDAYLENMRLIRGLPDTDALASTQLIERIFYYPDTKLTDQLMDTVGKKLSLEQYHGLPKHTGRYYSVVKNLVNFTSYMNNFTNNEALVIFQDVSSRDIWPNKLNYTIRMNQPVMPNRLMMSLLRSNVQTESTNEGFMWLQWAIDTSYINLMSHKHISQDVSLVEVQNDSDQPVTFVIEICAICSLIAFFLYFVFVMKRLLAERVSGIQELMKMVGVSPATITLAQFLNVLPAGVLYAIAVPYLLMSTDRPMVPHSSGLLMSIILFFQFLSVTAMAFACSYFSDTTHYSTALAVFIYVLMIVPVFSLGDINLRKKPVYLVLGLLPGLPVMWYWTQVVTLEQHRKGLNHGELWKSHDEYAGCYMQSILFLSLQTVLLYALGTYLGYVGPRSYGKRLPWNFCCKKSYWIAPKPSSIPERTESIVREEKYFEKSHRGSEIGIKIIDVTKIFPNHKALTKINLDVYKGEITILLGHNGAGKTTLMSIVTGMISPTKGKVYVNGIDITHHSSEVRKSIGLCPQHHLFFPDLNVLEHVIFFTLLKQGTYIEAKLSAMELLKQLGIEEKANSMSSELSGGMQRRLQLACALAGGAEVLVLDEPTSGLDVQTRRDLWDLLLSLRGNLTVLLSTHFMEEAEALGDRVAALHHGRLRCHATTLYLKRAVGSGYRLHLMTEGPPREETISQVVKSCVPDATVTHHFHNSLTYSLPVASTPQFPNLFSTLENKKEALGIDSIEVGMTTLEEVFLHLCSDDNTISEDQIDITETEVNYNRLPTAKVFQRQVFVLFQRQIKFILYKKYFFAVMQIIIPWIIIMFITKMKSHKESDNTDFEIDFPIDNGVVMFSMNTNEDYIKEFAKKYPNINFVETDNVTNAILSARNNNDLGLELNDTNAKILFSSTRRHSGPTGMNLLTNLLASQRLDPRSITTNNDPIKKTDTDYVLPKSQFRGMGWSLVIVIVLTASLINQSTLLRNENLSGARHTQIMAGCPIALHLGTTLLFHITLTSATVLLIIAISCIFVETEHTLDQFDFIFFLLLILFISSLAFLSFVYLISFCFGEVTLITIVVIFCVITPMIETGFLLKDNEHPVGRFCETVISWTMPPHTMMFAVSKCVNVARLNAHCLLNKNKCPLHIIEKGFDNNKCCAGENPLCYTCFDQYSPMKATMILLLQFIVYMSLVLLVSYGVFKRAHAGLMKLMYKPPMTTPMDESVQAEKTFVANTCRDPELMRNADRALFLNDVHKKYCGVCKSTYAVKGITLSVKKGECFGLLGVNGAGKSTTFKMLTAVELPTKGEIYGNGYKINENTGKYLRSLGYCPQFFGLDEFLTGIENIQLMLTLHGLDAADVDREAKTWIRLVGLEKYAQRPMSRYSGGMQRRLGAACALCYGAAVALLDEPTAGVDVAVRRRLWAALRTSLARGRTVLISSHSMDEMEALCHRVAIMAAGVVRALGSTRELRRRHAAGHALLLKLRHAATPAPSAGDDIDARVASLKEAVQSKFDCTLKDEHKTTLHYHINVSMRNSDLFKTLEALNSSFSDLIEDYSISETTLEEVFLSFAREQN